MHRKDILSACVTGIPLSQDCGTSICRADNLYIMIMCRCGKPCRFVSFPTGGADFQSATRSYVAATATRHGKPTADHRGNISTLQALQYLISICHLRDGLKFNCIRRRGATGHPYLEMKPIRQRDISLRILACDAQAPEQELELPEDMALDDDGMAKADEAEEQEEDGAGATEDAPQRFPDQADAGADENGDAEQADQDADMVDQEHLQEGGHAVSCMFCTTHPERMMGKELTAGIAGSTKDRTPKFHLANEGGGLKAP